MNTTNQSSWPASTRLPAPCPYSAVVLAALVSFSARAELPAPDNILYGSITLGSVAVTAADTNVIVEARRAADGRTVAHYRMGSDASAGSFYFLTLPLEELAPVTESPDASLAGDSLVLVVRNAAGVQAQLPYTIPERGRATRLDFGTAVLDLDADGLLDAWELLFFGNLDSRATGDPDGDGRNNLQEFLEGTDPNSPDAGFKLDITTDGTNQWVSFFARRAEGAGYEGTDRIYALEYSTNLSLVPWLSVPGRTNILGNNSTVTHLTTEPRGTIFYRGRLRLQAR